MPLSGKSPKHRANINNHLRTQPCHYAHYQQAAKLVACVRYNALKARYKCRVDNNIITVPTKPNSSAIIAKIESLEASGV
jgi:dTDP-4-dehydrorhamnose 3,5-epimerase-like enzyme